jgi:hypothetical protein
LGGVQDAAARSRRVVSATHGLPIRDATA